MLGAIFMDYRCELSKSPHIIIYGHDAKDLEGNLLMFGKLRQYRDDDFAKGHCSIKLICGDEVREYSLFAVKITDSTDESYRVDFAEGEFEAFAENIGAPPDAKEILTLSTCLGKDGVAGSRTA